LATDLSLGGTCAEEIIVRTGLDKNLEKLSSNEIKQLKKGLDSFFNEQINASSSKGKIFPVKMSSLNVESQFDSFNKGLDSINIETSTEVKKTSEQKKKKSKTASLLDIQEKRIRELNKEIDESQKKGEFVYENYQEFQKLITAIQEMRSKGKSFNEIEELLSKNKRFKKLDKAKKTVTMTWPDK
jgi:predicted ribosome quality control (RQC) complex YloA/Tae2 family protein